MNCSEFWDVANTLLGIGAIALAAVAAFNEYKGRKLDRQIALFDKRYNVYEGVMHFLSDAITAFNISDDSLVRLLRETKQAKFLFGKGAVVTYIDDLYRRGNRAQLIKTKYEKLPVGDERSRLISEESELFEYFEEQLQEADEMFRGYITLP